MHNLLRTVFRSCFLIAIAFVASVEGSTATLPIEPAGTIFEEHHLPPSGRSDFRGDYYPAAAILRNQHGRVSLAYSVEADGHPVRIAIVESIAPVLDARAVDFLQLMKFFVPSDWASSGGPVRRYRFRVQFNIVVHGESPPPADPEADLTVSGTGISRR